MSQQQPATGTSTSNPASIPPEAIALAGKMYGTAREGDAALLEQAITAGLPPNLTNDKGDTLLMLAAYHSHANIVRFLIHHGADPNTLNDRQQSPLAGAVFKKEDDVIEALLEGGADPEYGIPSAMECIVMFKQQDTWKAKFEGTAGRGQVAAEGH